jgi:hypothetical protein
LSAPCAAGYGAFDSQSVGGAAYAAPVFDSATRSAYPATIGWPYDRNIQPRTFQQPEWFLPPGKRWRQEETVPAWRQPSLCSCSVTILPDLVAQRAQPHARASLARSVIGQAKVVLNPNHNEFQTKKQKTETQS